LVYTTLQAYLVRAPDFLDFLITHARENEYALGVKLVRGAYIDAEVAAHARHKPHAQTTYISNSRSPEVEVVKACRTMGHKSISPDQRPPTYPSKEATDAAYDACVRVLVREVAKDVGRARFQPPGVHEKEIAPSIAVLFGTHNWRSSRLVLDEILRLGLGKEIVESGVGERNEVGGDRSKDMMKTEKKIILNEEVRQRICMAQLYGESLVSAFSFYNKPWLCRHVRLACNISC
jgi:proline dehydrogenase